MKLQKIFPELNLEPRVKELRVGDLNRDSRNVKKDDLFFVMEGKQFDVFSVIADIEDKVAAFICDIKNKAKIERAVKKKPVILVKDINREFVRVIDSFYGVKKDKFEFIGVTGTNGKTTSTYFIYQFLQKMNKSVSLIGTVNYCVGPKVYEASNTTPDYLSLMKMLKSCRSEKEKFVVMEVSSHGIDQNRVEGINFKRCVFTNLTRDHLDYHKTMARYFAVKKKLFFHGQQPLGVINVDDVYGRKLLKEVPLALTYGIDRKADVMAVNVRQNKTATVFDLLYKGKARKVKVPVLGMHNVSNVLAACATVLSLGGAFNDLCAFIPSLKSARGRLEMVYDGIFVDYAHTPDALTRVLSVLGQIGYKNIISVFGCGGERDSGKRLLMGRIASRFSVFSVITSDNPRGECPHRICSQIEEGFKKKNYAVIIDREEAIKAAISMRNKYKDCCVLVAGKGHEDYQIIGDEKIKFSDSEVIKKEIDIRRV